MTNNNITISGSINNALIQQASRNSNQSIAQTTNFDYNKLLTLLSKIKESTNSDLFLKEFGPNAKETKILIEKAIILVEQKQEPERITPLIVKLKSLASDVGSGIIANGICTLLGQFL